jgi:hypothetical protein
VEDDGLADGEAVDKLGPFIVALADGNGPDARPALFDDIDLPFVAAPEERAERHTDDIWIPPDGDVHHHAELVPEALPDVMGVDDIKKDVDALLIDAKRRDLRVSRWIYAVDASTKRIAAPIVDPSLAAVPL